MNNLTKKSYYSFLALYLISSFIFLTLAAYWFYTSQVAMEKNNNFYKMNHIADHVSTQVIKSAMEGTKFKLPLFPDAKVALYTKEKQLLYGSNTQDVDFTQEFYMKNGLFTLVSKRTAGHLGVEYIVVQSSECIKNIDKIKNKILYTVIITALLIIIIAIVLSYIFLKPLRDKMEEIEVFVKDTTHELNTPITAIMMSTSRLKKKKEYDAKTVQNISISVKQLYDIYTSLSYLSFDTHSQEPTNIAFDKLLQESIEYFQELLEKKNISLDTDIQDTTLLITPIKAKMLINNLLSNAIKYSNPNSTITITLTPKHFIIQDEGIGISKENLKKIFIRYERANSYAGGFGVGLSIVHAIIQEHNYSIDIHSQEHQGTKIIIYF